MKILVITPRIPSRDRKGDQVVSFFRVLHLARRHEVRVLCYGHGADDAASREVLQAAGVSIEMLPLRRMASILSLAKTLFNSEPFQCALYRSSAFQRALERTIATFQPEALLAVTIRILPNLNVFPSRLYVDMVDSMSLNFQRRLSGARWPMRWLLKVEHRRVQAYERMVANSATASFVVSAIDQREIGCGTVHALPLGIDLDQFQCVERPKPAPLIAFTGNMSYEPNVRAITWFVASCWQRIKDMEPTARLVIAGGNPDPGVRALAADVTVTVTGRVPSMADILNESTVAIAPMQSGSGMQFKILEAMACGIPVVTTTLGLGDIMAQPARDLWVADRAEDFTTAVVTLLRSSSSRTSMAQNGLAYVREQHGWPALNQRFCLLCEQSSAR